MKKKSSLRKYILVSVIVVIGILLSVCKVNIVGTLQKYQGFINAINYGGDFSSSTLVTMEVDALESETLSDADVLYTMDKLYLLTTTNDNAYMDVRVYRQDTSNDKVRICVLIPNKDVSTALYEAMETRKELKVTATNSATASAVITNEHIKSASYTVLNEQTGIIVELTAEGKTKMAGLVSQLGGSSPYCFIDETSMSGQVYGNNNYLFITSDSLSASEASTTAVALIAGSYPVSLTYITPDTSSELSSSLGDNALLAVGILSLAIIIIAIVIMILRYKILGLIFTLNFAILFVLLTLFLQAVPLVSFTMTSFFACLYTIIVFVITNGIMYNAMGNEYKLGKKIPACVSMGYKKVLLRIVDIYVVQFLVALLIIIIGSTVLKNFAIVMIIGLLISMLCTLVFTKSFVSWYLPINSTDPTKYSFTREADVDEIN